MLQFAEEVAEPRKYLPHHASRPPQATSQDAGRLTEVIDYIAGAGFTFEPWQVATFVTALRTKPFLILAGISGTGKTKLPQLVAEATGAEAVVVPVRPDWTDSSDLLGYERLNGEFVPGHLLTLCEGAMRDPDTQYFFVLDEMNVARVEYYFAELLSVMENRRWADSLIVSDPLNRSAPNQSGDEAPGVDWSSVYLPAQRVDHRHGQHGRDHPRLFPQGPRPGLRAGVVRGGPRRLRVSDPQSNPAVVDAVNALVRANESLQRAQLQVGFRVCDEVSMFCLNALGSQEHFVDSEETVIAPLDLCLSMKVLPPR